MNTDSYFTIGTTHSVCQDYAFAGDDYVILSDGCSTSPDTDIGSRLLVRAASQLLLNPNSDDVVTLHKRATHLALDWAKEIGLPPQSVDATLLTAQSDDGDLIVGTSGDGVVIFESLSGNLDIYSISFPNGCPLYPAYEHQPDRLIAWRNRVPYKEIRHFQTDRDCNSLELVETTRSSNVTEILRRKASEYKQAAIISDGIHSFYKTEDSTTSKHATSIPMDEVLKELIAFKGGRGAFVARRARKFEKSCAANSWHHADDLAIAAIYLATEG